MHQLHAVVHRGERVAQLVREDREEIVLALDLLLEQRLRALALGDLGEQLLVRALERAVQLMELARVLGLERGVRGRELDVRGGHRLVEARELAALQI